MIAYLFDNNFDYNVKNKSINDLSTVYLNKIVQNSYILYIIMKHVMCVVNLILDIRMN